MFENENNRTFNLVKLPEMSVNRVFANEAEVERYVYHIGNNFGHFSFEFAKSIFAMHPNEYKISVSEDVWHHEYVRENHFFMIVSDDGTIYNYTELFKKLKNGFVPDSPQYDYPEFTYTGKKINYRKPKSSLVSKRERIALSVVDIVDSYNEVILPGGTIAAEFSTGLSDDMVKKPRTARTNLLVNWVDDSCMKDYRSWKNNKKKKQWQHGRCNSNTPVKLSKLYRDIEEAETESFVNFLEAEELSA